MVNLIQMTMSSDNTGIVKLTDGRELNQDDAFIVNKNTYRKFLEWEKVNIQNRYSSVNEEIDKLAKESITLLNESKRVIRELEII